jgi:predicted phosphodiesterase
MIYKIFSDLHWGQTSEILTNVYPENGDIFLGDIFDIKNTSKKLIATQLAKQVAFRRNCNVVGAYYVIGNHDLIKDPMNNCSLHRKINNVLFTHGHLIMWDQATIDKWDAKEPVGVGKFRQIILEIQNLYTRGVWKPGQIEIDRAAKLAKDNGCDTIVLGHTHSKERVDFKNSGVRIINVQRGMSVIEA